MLQESGKFSNNGTMWHLKKKKKISPTWLKVTSVSFFLLSQAATPKATDKPFLYKVRVRGAHTAQGDSHGSVMMYKTRVTNSWAGTGVASSNLVISATEKWLTDVLICLHVTFYLHILEPSFESILRDFHWPELGHVCQPNLHTDIRSQ